MKIVITIDTENDAFQPEPEHEVVRVLLRLKDDVRHHGIRDLKLQDSNGNTVGGVAVVR